MTIYGLIGRSIGYSFSRKFFSDKFANEGLVDCKYMNFDLESIDEFPTIFKTNQNVAGLNCTIPYKEEIMAHLDEIDSEAALVGAVNTVKIVKTSGGIRLKGFNTDTIGFENSILPILTTKQKKAIILGTGGASKAVKHILAKLNIQYLSATRREELLENEIHYADIDSALMEESLLIINTTPLGTFPNTDTCANIPYQFIGKDHVLFDLVYNPEETLFMKKGKEQGATTKNGSDMLAFQALASWEIWNR